MHGSPWLAEQHRLSTATRSARLSRCAAPDPEVARLAGVLSERIELLVDRLTELIAGEIDIYSSDAVAEQAELHRSVRDNVEYMICVLSTWDDPDLSVEALSARWPSWSSRCRRCGTAGWARSRRIDQATIDQLAAGLLEPDPG